MPRKMAILDLWRADMDAQHVGSLASAVFACASGQSFVVGLTQGGDKRLTQLAHGHGIDAVVDGLVRHAMHMVFGVQVCRCASVSTNCSGDQCSRNRWATKSNNIASACNLIEGLPQRLRCRDWHCARSLA